MIEAFILVVLFCIGGFPAVLGYFAIAFMSGVVRELILYFSE